MYIVSKFHDYYDTASIYGQDKTCVYKRAEESFKVERANWDQPYFVKLKDGKRFQLPRTGGKDSVAVASDGMQWVVTHNLLGFCGQFYPMVSVHQRFEAEEKTFHFYEFEEYWDFVTKVGLRKERGYYSPRWDRYNISQERGAKAFFSDVAEINTKYADLFHAFKSPVVVIGDSVVINPSLRKLGFMKVKDPQTAFQDIYMFISGVIGVPAKETVVVSDEVKAASRGHDGEYSFKKPPGKRGKNRWR